MEKVAPFQHAIFFIALLVKLRYVTWPFFGAICILLVTNRIYPMRAVSAIVAYLWWISLITLVLFLVSATTSWYLSDEDKYARLALYGLSLAGSPILISCIISLFFKPR
jgi:putative Ca2+/H+ antiporter (TMEM165/GDT1 family)